MAHVTEDDVVKLARLARLKLNQEEISRYTKEFEALLDYVSILDTVDTTGLTPTYQVSGLVNVQRQDEIVAYSASADELLAEAPASENHQYKTRRVIE